MFESIVAEVAFLAGRVLFGGVLAVMGLGHFGDVDSMADYAAFKGLPAPRLSVVASGAVLVLGGLSLVLGVFPAVGAGALAIFLLLSAVTMHDFWAVDGEEAQTEQTQFFKNVFGAGAALAFLALATAEWPYALDVGF